MSCTSPESIPSYGGRNESNQGSKQFCNYISRATKMAVHCGGLHCPDQNSPTLWRQDYIWQGSYWIMGGKWEAVLEMTRNFLNSSHISDFVNILSNECFLPFIHYQTQTTFLVLLKQSGKKEVSGHARQDSLFFSSKSKKCWEISF